MSTTTATSSGVVAVAGAVASQGTSVVTVTGTADRSLIRTVTSDRAVSPGASFSASRRGCAARTGFPLSTEKAAVMVDRTPLVEVRRAVTVWAPSASCQVS